MLILTRDIDQEIIIDGNIRVKVLGINRGQVKLGVHAPKEVTVHRKEIQERIESGAVHIPQSNRQHHDKSFYQQKELADKAFEQEVAQQ